MERKPQEVLPAEARNTENDDRFIGTVTLARRWPKKAQKPAIPSF
jgi:hypothetical protein